LRFYEKDGAGLGSLPAREINVPPAKTLGVLVIEHHPNIGDVSLPIPSNKISYLEANPRRSATDFGL
jgi:hypothetical protein